MEQAGSATRGEEYAQRLIRLQMAPWKRWLNVQAIFRWNLTRLQPGFTLVVGCGIGRDLANLGGNGVGVDTNEYCVRTARHRGFIAFTPDELRASPEYNAPGRFDSLLLAHVAEHMTEAQAIELLREYVHLVRAGGGLILIAPQEAGFKSDHTHVQMMDFTRLRRICEASAFTAERAFSYPLPRWAGRFFTYNEFVVTGRKPGAAAASHPGA
jgi:SAM-dependent methyltransferase